MIGFRTCIIIMGATSYFIVSLFLVTNSYSFKNSNSGILYPQDSETRQKISLDGLWNFIQANTSRPLDGYMEHWYEKRFSDLNTTIQLMPVPASYNDITTDWQLRDHVGIVWYERFFRVPKTWCNSERIWIRFGSVSYAAQVWINGHMVISHQIGHLPFQADITDWVDCTEENKITVACDNTLLEDTVPQGKINSLRNGRRVQTYTFDFFNYAGIDRSVFLYSTPQVYVDDISIVTEEINKGEAVLSYNVSFVNNSTLNVTCYVYLLNEAGNMINNSSCENGETSTLTVTDPKLWWPYLMDDNPGYQYTFEVRLVDEFSALVDVYRLRFGIRKLSWTSDAFLINGQKLYLHGFGRHEDSDIRGKGLDLPLIIRDYNLIKWIGANAYRTSHYPYAEEIMDLADSHGIMIIDECPGVNIEGFSDSLLSNHKRSLTELIKRDKNRPSVIMWSAANEPRTQEVGATAYFEAVINHIKSLDRTRPTTIVEAQGYTATDSSKFVDIVSFNRYNGWYMDEGNMDDIKSAVTTEAINWRQRFQKPVIMQEYGGDALEGLHFLPDFIWSEEYQVDLMSQHFEAFDNLRSQEFFIGEFIWNFADFKTAQSYTRVGGNKKGLFTRSRQPKASAYLLRKRYWNLANELYDTALPKDLDVYIASSKSSYKHSEL